MMKALKMKSGNKKNCKNPETTKETIKLTQTRRRSLVWSLTFFKGYFPRDLGSSHNITRPNSEDRTNPHLYQYIQ